MCFKAILVSMRCSSSALAEQKLLRLTLDLQRSMNCGKVGGKLLFSRK